MNSQNKDSRKDTTVDVVSNEERTVELATVYSRENVTQDPKIRVVDEDEETGLELFCYTSCGNKDTDFVKGCRGIVFHKDQLVMKAFPYTDEYNHTETECLTKMLSNFSDWSFYTAYEGALIRLFYFSGKWFLSTHRKLNAFRSKWSSRDSFGTLFKRALENEISVNVNFREKMGDDIGWENILDRFQTLLDKSKQYMFLLRNTRDNRIVCSPPNKGENLLFHVGTINNGGELSLTDNIGISYPEKQNFTEVKSVLDKVETLDYNLFQGIMCFGANGRQIKIVHKEYQDYFRARGNEPSVKFRYLQVRTDKKLRSTLYHLYPEMTNVFDEIENIIYDIARYIYRAYVQRFIKKNYVTVPKEEYLVINEAHGWHIANRANNKVTLEVIIVLLNKQNSTHLNHMIRRFKTENYISIQ
jgi:hypothetical protein